MAVGNTKVVQVTNIAPQATKDQMQTLFGYLGKIEDIRLYPTIRDVSCPVQSRICYVKFVDSTTVGIAQHMTNTVFIDRALIVIPVQSGDIPDEYYALEMTRNGTIVPGFNVNEPKMPPHVVNSVQGFGVDQVILTTDQQLETNGLPPYPPLPATYDSIKVEETRRTVLAINIDSSATNDEIIDFFSAAGEVKYLRSCTRQSDEGSNYMLIEFTDQPSVLQALKMNGKEFKGKILEIQHSTQAIVKPQAKSNEAAQKEIEEAMSRFKEAQNLINASIEPVIGMLTKDKRSSRRSRSRSRGRRHRSRSRSRSRRSRSRRRRSRSRSRRRTRSRERRRRSKSRSKKRSRSRSRKRSRSRGSRSRRSRSKSATRRRSRHRSRDRDSRAKSREKDRKSRDRDRSRDRKRSKERDRDRKSKERDRDREKSKEVSSRELKEKKSEKESSVDNPADKKRSRSRSHNPEKKRSRSRSHTAVEKKRSRSRSRNRSRSRDRKSRDKRRSRSRGGRRRTPSPRKSRHRSRSRSRDRKRDKKEKDKKDRRDRSRSRSKVPRNYDEEEKGYDADKDKEKSVTSVDADNGVEKDSSEKSDNMDISNSP